MLVSLISALVGESLIGQDAEPVSMIKMISFRTRYGLRWGYRFFRTNGNGVIRSLIKACLLRKGRTIKVYPSGDSVVSEIRDDVRSTE